MYLTEPLFTTCLVQGTLESLRYGLVDTICYIIYCNYILHLKLAGETMYQLSSACIPHTCAPSSSSLCCVVLWFVVITTTHIKMYGASVISGLISTFYMCVLVMHVHVHMYYESGHSQN